MPGFFVHVGAKAQCPHRGQVATAPGNARVRVSQQMVATMADQFPIAGCTFMVGSKPQPCVKVQWLVPALRVRASGQAVILKDSGGICQSAEQAPQGLPQVSVTQTRVRGM